MECRIIWEIPRPPEAVKERQFNKADYRITWEIPRPPEAVKERQFNKADYRITWEIPRPVEAGLGMTPESRKRGGKSGDSDRIY